MSDRLTFHAEPPPRVVEDLVLRCPTLLLGWWQDPTGRRVKAELCTMVQSRAPHQLREFLTPAAVSVALADAAPAHSEVIEP